MKQQGKGIGQRIGQLVALAVFAAVSLVALTLALVQVSANVAETRSSLQNTSFALAATAADAVLAKDRAKAFDSLVAVSRISQLRMVALLDKDGKVLANLGQAAVLNGDMAQMEDNTLSVIFKGTMPVAVDIVKGAKPVGRLVLLADISQLRRDFLLTVLTTLVAAATAAAAGFLVSRPLQKRITGPVSALTEQISAIKASRDFRAQITVENDIGEVGTLVEAFDSLMADIRFRDQSLQKLAYFDPLTGLPNRASLLNLLDQHKTGPGQSALAIFGICKFGTLTNAFGQTIGDAVLLSVAAALRDSANGAFTARIGSHDFAVYFPGVSSAADIESRLAPIMAAFIHPLRILRSDIKIDVNCGVVVVEDAGGDTVDPSSLLRCAALALDDAQNLGSNRAVYYRPEMKDKARTRSELGQELRCALASRALEAHFQPQLDVNSGRITGFEALARWNHPTRGYVSPTVFVPIAEENGFITELGDWILEESCKQAAYWLRHTRLPRVISVNVSAAQFMENGFATKVADVLTRHGLPSHLLCLEVTESIFIGSSVGEIRNTLSLLQDMGVMLALDDFGTGYSSLGYMERLPLNIVKIDRSFVAAADKSARKVALLQSIIGMIHAIGLEAVAEGAETEAEIALLKSLGVDKIQGYGIAPPMPSGLALAAATRLDAGLAAIAN